jgi:transposase
MTGTEHADGVDPRDIEIAELKTEVARLNSLVAELQAKLAEMQELLRQNSQNSSRPPSSDPPGVSAMPRKRKRGRKPGGQPGHKGHRRRFLSVEERNVHDVRPERCKKCGARLKGNDPHPHRHQVVEAPEPKPEVEEWRLHALDCGDCGETTRAELPPGVPRGGYGPRLVAIIALLSGAFRLSKRQTVELLANLYGVPISLGSITACQQIASEAVVKPVQEAREFVKEQAIKHADESSWREGPTRSKVWLWTVTTPLVTVFLICGSRGKDIAQKMLGKFLGVLVSDRWCAYSWWPLKWRQLCWAHIRRHFKAMSECKGEAKEIGEKLLVLERRLFELWHRIRDGTLVRSSFRVYVSHIRVEMRALLRRGSQCSHRKTSTTCSELLKLEPAMWTFTRMDCVEPTNNSGERAIRPGVIWRKLCFGTHSRWGSRFVERMLSVVYTLHQQHRSPLGFLTDCVSARMKRQPVTASLLPSA